MKIVAGDIGGTHARFAVAELTPGAPVRIVPPRDWKCEASAAPNAPAPPWGMGQPNA